MTSDEYDAIVAVIVGNIRRNIGRARAQVAEWTPRPCPPKEPRR